MDNNISHIFGKKELINGITLDEIHKIIRSHFGINIIENINGILPSDIEIKNSEIYFKYKGEVMNCSLCSKDELNILSSIPIEIEKLIVQDKTQKIVSKNENNVSKLEGTIVNFRKDELNDLIPGYYKRSNEEILDFLNKLYLKNKKLIDSGKAK